MTILRSLRIVLLLAAASPVAQGQTATVQDRVISGNANLSTLSKEAQGGGVSDAALRSVLVSGNVNVVVIQKRGQSSASSSQEYWILYAVGKETTFREIKITIADYNWLINRAVNFNQL